MRFYVLSVCNRSWYLFAVEFARIEDLFGDESIKLSRLVLFLSNVHGFHIENLLDVPIRIKRCL